MNYRNTERAKKDVKGSCKIHAIKIITALVALFLFIIAIRTLKHSDFIKGLHQHKQIDDNTMNETVYVAKQDASQYSVSLSSLKFDDVSSTRQVGKTINSTHSSDNIFYSVSYPETGLSPIDEVLKSAIDAELNNFLENNSSYVAESDSMRSGLTIDYQSYLTGDSLLSVVFSIIFYSPELSNPVYSVQTHTFLLCTCTEIPLGSLLAGDYLVFLSSRVSGYLSSVPEYSETMDESVYAGNYTPDMNNFTSYSISQSGLTLYFNPFTIAPGEYGIISIHITPDEILPFMIYDPFIDADIPVNPAPTAGTSIVQAEIDPEKPMVALTFDDGPREKSTNRILDVLEKYNCHATFFVVGSRVSANAETVKRASDLGCDIGNHSYSHSKLSTLGKNGIKEQISKTNDVLKKIINKKAKFVRTPYGQTGSVLKYVNYPVILWDVDTTDWKTLNAKKVVKAATAGLNDGDIILMHDIYDSTAEAVESIVPRLIDKGIQIVSISELFRYRGIKPKKHKEYFYLKPEE